MTDDSFVGFTEVSAGKIPEITTHARHFRHEKTGADVVFLLNADVTQTFAIAFRTHPTNSTGVAHVLEHCVLSGSRAYPSKKLFVELLKGSLQSYLNASTFADFTIYPAASPHPKDFNNLVNAYLDAVFFPLLTKESFRREGWHLAADGTRQGVVLNEMKGICASPVHMLAEHGRRSLFRAGPFRHAYGGDPEQITGLTHDQMKLFHRQSYHPSNALVAYSGVSDIPSELRRLGQVFNQFEREEVCQIRPWPVISTPRTLTFSQAGAGVSRLALNWAFPAPNSRLVELAYDVLCEALVGQPYAPLRRALIDAGYCTDVVEGRFSDDTSPPRLSIQLVGVDAQRAKDVQRTVCETMERLLQTGLDTQIIAGALNAVDFRSRDRSSWKRPHAVGLLLDVAKGWRLGRDPLHGLAFASELTELRRKSADFFADMLKAHLIENPRFTMVVLTADTVKADSTVPAPPHGPPAASSDRPTPRAKPRKATGVPCLALRDLAPDPVEDLMAVDQVSEVPILFHQRQTNGLCYADLAFDLHGLSQPSCAALFARVLLRSGTARRSARDMTSRIGAETGGLSCEMVSAPLAKGAGAASHLILRGRTLAGRLPCLFDILGELLSEWQLPEPQCLSEIVGSEINRVRSQILPKAHEFLDRRLRRHVNATEYTDGLSYLQFLYDFQTLLLHNPDQARQRLRQSHTTLACRKRLTISLTLDRPLAADLRDSAEGLVRLLPAGKPGEPLAQRSSLACSEGFIVSSEANFVGMAFNLPTFSALRNSALFVGLKYLETGWIWQKLREEGGAYGALCRGDPLTGLCTFLTYRDPYILRTLDVFATSGQQLGQGVSRDDLNRAVIATIGRLDRPLSPSDSAFKALTDWLTGWNNERRRAFRTEVLTTGTDELKDIGDALSEAEKSASIAIFGSREALTHALVQRPDLFELEELLGG